MEILTQSENISLLREAFRYVIQKYSFTIDAIVILPDHIHCMWTLPESDYDYSVRWRLLKSYFSRRCDGKYKNKPSESRQKKKEQASWQRRYWEHLVRDENDFTRHVEYIHYNPVKHGLVRAPIDWEYSSFRRYVRDGIYDRDWGADRYIIFDESIGRE
jgi:putative transposase